MRCSSAPGLGSTTFHFDGDGALVGVHTESDVVLACSGAAGAPASSERTYGRACTPQGIASDACVIDGCLDIACISGATFKADWPFDFEQASEIPLTACRNDRCFTGMLAPSSERPTTSSGVGFSVPEPEVRDRDHTGHAEFWFRGSSDGRIYLQMQWWAWSDAELQDGDRYRVTAEAPAGTYVLVDREVDYGRTDLGSGQCLQSCRYIELDERGESSLVESDGGVDDAGR